MSEQTPAPDLAAILATADGWVAHYHQQLTLADRGIALCGLGAVLVVPWPAIRAALERLSREAELEARIEDIEAEREEASEAMRDLQRDADGAFDAAGGAEERVEKLEVALREYGQHLPACSKYVHLSSGQTRWDPSRDCSCGWEETHKALLAQPAEEVGERAQG